MAKSIKYLLWGFFIFLAVGVGLYPFLYFIADLSGGLMSTKPDVVLHDAIWRFAFFQHITFGGVSLLVGWSQFIDRIRIHRVRIHRTLGKIYLISVLLSGTAGLYIAFYATGGIVSQLGFGTLAVLWLICSALAYYHIINNRVTSHQKWMIRSYALTFAAVTLRLWLPFFEVALSLDFNAVYPAVAWLCWVPNILVAEIIIRAKRLHMVSD